MIVKELHVMPGCVTYLCLRLVIKVEPEKGTTYASVEVTDSGSCLGKVCISPRELIDGAQFQS